MRYRYTVRQPDQMEDEAPLEGTITETTSLQWVQPASLRPLIQESIQNHIPMNLKLDWGATHYMLRTYF